MSCLLPAGKTKRILQLLAATGLALFALPGFADNCGNLAVLRFPHTTITRAEVVAGGKFTPATGKALENLPAFCRVVATVRPSADSDISVEIWLPQADWNQRLEGTGNGGFAGKISYGALAEGLRRGYAVANTDMGMATPAGANAGIFINRPERWVDWGYRATHEMTLLAKQVVRAYYARDARRAYFVGCSTGGEQALMETQRYPDDYDGIVGGAAANNRTGVHVSILWNFAVNERAPASYLPAAARSLLSQAVVNACDRLDGVTDGVIADPTKCHFDPASLQCKSTNQESCLTASQLETVRQIYSGPVNPRTGQSLYPGLPRGSEFGWDGLDPNPGGTPPYAPIFQWVFGPQWDWRQFDFDHDDAIYTQKLLGMVNATNPDIDTFRAHGHKLLMYHGWSDWLVAPEESIN
jgi:feruloyl esterase